MNVGLVETVATLAFTTFFYTLSAASVVAIRREKKPSTEHQLHKSVYSERGRK